MIYQIQRIATIIDEMTYREFVAFVADLKPWIDDNTAKDPDEKWRSAISAWAEARKEGQ